MAVISRGAMRMAGAASVLVAFGQLRAIAASATTEAFLANVIPNVDFLDRSSRLALTNTKNARIKAFAFSEAAEQTLAANDIYDHAQAEKKSMVADGGKLDRTPTASIKGAGSATPTPKASVDAIPDDRLPVSQEDLDSLEGLEGSVFDAQYKEKQLDALRQIETDYRDYGAKGDDPTLRAFATRELPKVTRRIAQLGKI